MNMNWKIMKAAAAFVVIVGVIFWVINATRSESYNATDLNFEVGSGAVVVTNPMEQEIPVQLMGTGTRTFRVSSDIEGVSGTSTREGTGSTATQLFEFELPSGTSEFFIRRGTNVTFVATASNELQATVYPMTADSSRNTLLMALVVIVGSLFYASNAMEHRWIRRLTGNEEMSINTESTSSAGGQGRTARAFGDNRK